jgi:hypothetical protein
MRRACAAALTLMVVLAPGAGAQDDVAVLLARAGAFVEAFQRDFGAVVAEERYEQSVRQAMGAISRSSRGVPQLTVLRSDFLLVQVEGEGWLPFRDVFERDGKQVRDREQRLADIFLTGSRTAVDQARAIMSEGARYNIGNVDRNINVPTLPLPFLTAAHRQRFSFKLGRREDPDGAVIEFRETASPTFVATTGGRDLPIYGRYWIDAETGTIRRTEVHAVDIGVEAHITVTYQRDDATGLWVPARMEERFRRQRDPSEVYGVATYSKFRRFTVSTSSETVLP